MAAKDADFSGAVTNDMNPLEASQALRTANDKAYRDTIKSYAFNKPGNFRDLVLARIKAANPDVPDPIANKVATDLDMRMELHSSGQPQVSGTNLWNARTESSHLFGQYSQAEKQALKDGLGTYDDLITNQLTQGNSPQNLADLAKLQQVRGHYENLRAVEKATAAADKSAKEGQFSPSQLAAASKPNSQPRVLANAVQATLGRPLATPGMAGRSIMYGLLGGLKLGAKTLIAAPAVMGAASKTGQRLALGDTEFQQALANRLRQFAPGDLQNIANQGIIFGSENQ
jgi:hypothetical protein